jgi:hypothetical protein
VANILIGQRDGADYSAFAEAVAWPAKVGRQRCCWIALAQGSARINVSGILLVVLPEKCQQ